MNVQLIKSAVFTILLATAVDTTSSASRNHRHLRERDDRTLVLSGTSLTLHRQLKTTTRMCVKDCRSSCCKRDGAELDGSGRLCNTEEERGCFSQCKRGCHSPNSDCDPSQEKLADYEAYRREEGYWIGEYTFLGADGNPFVGSTWNYPYDHYMGFIHLELNGPNLRQRNVFLYPPQVPDGCTDDVDGEGNPTDVVGGGKCGVNGNEKIFSADQQTTDCEGGLSGPSSIQGNTHTETKIIGDDTVLYQVRLEPGGPFVQNQLTTLPGDGTRVRTAQGFNPFLPDGMPTWQSTSYYRERKVDRDEFFGTLSEIRSKYAIREDDYCGFDSIGGPTGISCEEHFGESTAP